MAPPAAGARRRRLPGRGHRRPGLRALVGAAGRRGLPDAAPRRRQRRPRRAPSARSRPSSSVTTGARRSRGTRRCCGPTCSAPSAACRCRSGRPGTPARPTPSVAWPATRSSTSSTSSSPGRAERELDEDVRRWLLGFYFTASGDAPPPSGRHGGDDPARRQDARPLRLSRPDAGVDDRGRPRRVRRRVRAHRVHRRAQPLPQRRSRLGGPLGVPGPADRGAGPVRRRRPRRPDDLGDAVDRALPRHAAEAARVGDPVRLRSLDPAGAAGRGQRGAARLPCPPCERVRHGRAPGARRGRAPTSSRPTTPRRPGTCSGAC